MMLVSNFFKSSNTIASVVKRTLSLTTIANKTLCNTNNSERPEWTVVLKEAEKIVGYPTSFLNLRWLLSDELANVAMHLRKLIGTDHPLLKTARDLFIRNDLPSWGLIVLLFSKTIGFNEDFKATDEEFSEGVLYNQRALAEITEMIRKSIIVHQALLNFSHELDDAESMNYGNKIALLSGDYLLCKSYLELAGLKHPEVNEHISSALRNLTEGEFFGLHDSQNKPIPSQPTKTNQYFLLEEQDNLEFGTEPLDTTNVLGNAYAEWLFRSTLTGANLLGKSCQCAFMLAGHPKSKQDQGYRFGKHLALAWQAYMDKNLFLNQTLETFSLVSAPVLFHLEYDPSTYSKIEVGLENVETVDYDDLRTTVLSGPGLNKTNDIQKQHAKIANDLLNLFPSGEAKNALCNVMEVFN